MRILLLCLLLSACQSGTGSKDWMYENTEAMKYSLGYIK